MPSLCHCEPVRTEGELREAQERLAWATGVAPKGTSFASQSVLPDEQQQNSGRCLSSIRYYVLKTHRLSRYKHPPHGAEQL